MCCGFHSRRWRPNVSIVTVLGLVGGAPAQGWGRPRVPCGGGKFPELPTGARDRSKGCVRRHLARKGASAVPTPRGRCAGLQRLARSVALWAAWRPRKTLPDHKPAAPAGPHEPPPAGKHRWQRITRSQPALPDRTTATDRTTTSHERRRDRGGGAPAPEEVHLRLSYEPAGSLCAAEGR